VPVFPRLGSVASRGREEVMKKLPPRETANVNQAIIRVGSGRGFMVAYRRKRLVITAAHCLPVDDAGYHRPPPAIPAMGLDEKTYSNLLGALGTEPSVWCECLFVNPVSDIAVFGSRLFLNHSGDARGVRHQQGLHFSTASHLRVRWLKALAQFSP
jgi:hypothetical protein